MKSPTRALGVILLAMTAGSCRVGRASPDRLPLDTITLPSGFSIGLYARVPGARFMTLGDHGVVFVGTRAQGRVYAVVPDRGTDRTGHPIVVARGLHEPNGVAFRDGALYVAEIDRVLRYDDIEADLTHPRRPAIVRAGLPAMELHGPRVIRFGPDGRLYIGIGVPCDLCMPTDPRTATLMRMNPDGSDFEVFARGIRNTEGFDWQPATHDLWFTDNGIDLLGQNMPSDELDRAPRPGLNFGYPYCHGRSVPDPWFATEAACARYVPAAAALGAHVAPLGMQFYTGRQFPASYRGQILIAEHGSTNRTMPTGYGVALVSLNGDRVVGSTMFASGWLEGTHAWGRPVDVLVMPDGAVLVSDDTAGAIYRIAYGR